VLATAREVLARLERYELEIFADEEPQGEDKALIRAARRRIIAQASLFES
jgi:hypothetical protein